MRKFHNGFTLLEIAVSLIVMSVLLTITFSLFSLNKDFWLLNEKSLYFAKNLNGVKKLSLQGARFSGKKICGAGILIDKNKNEYFGIAVDIGDISTGLLSCSGVDAESFDLTKINDLESNQNVIKISKFFDFTTAPANLLKENFENVVISVYLNEEDSPINFEKLEIIFTNPYADPRVFVSPYTISSEINDWNKINFDLKFKDETSRLTITKTGQILFK